MMLAQQRSTICSSTPAFRSSQRRPRCVLVRASGGAESNGKAIEEGASVRVVAAVKVFHAPGAAEDGLDLQGKTGTMVKNTIFYKGKELSPNLPFKVQFAVEKPDGTQGKFFAHLDAGELEVV